jgi:hypothetical protein
MKTLKLLVIAALLLPLGLNLQAQKINYGVLAGYDLSYPYVGWYEDYGTKLFCPMHSFNVNGFVEYRLSETWGIAAEPGYIRKGGVFKDKEDILNSSDHQLRLHYIQLPILANVYFSDRFFISFGPEFAYLINKDARFPSLEEQHSAYYKFTPLEESAFEISALIGVNYSITKHIDLALRYSHGVTPFTEIGWINPRYGIDLGMVSERSNAYNQYLQFIVRYRIKAGAKPR